MLSKLAATAAFSVGVMLAAAPAHAATVNLALGGPAGPYNLSNPTGIIVPNFLHGYGLIKTKTYNFTFSVSPGAYTLLADMTKYGASTVMGGPQPVAFYLYSGTPTGVHSLLGFSGSALNATFTTNITGGNYYMQLRPVDIAGPDQLVRGGITLSAIPEPATWGLMITGFGLLGLAARRRRELGSAVA